MITLEQAATKMQNKAESAAISGKWDRAVMDPSAMRDYYEGMRKFIGHAVSVASERWYDGVLNASSNGNYTKNPTNSRKWIEAMKNIQ